MYVVKRDGKKEPVYFDKITSRIQKLCYGLNMDFIDPPAITLKVINGLYPGVQTVQLDNIAAETAVRHSNEHPDYALLAARIEVSNLHKETKKSFSEVTEYLYNLGYDMSEKYYKFVQENRDRLNSAIIYDRDFMYTYFGFKVLEANYLRQVDGKVVERPQHMLMRVAISIHKDDIEAAIETYNLLSERWYMPTPQTMNGAGFLKEQLMSGCSITMSDDSIEGIFGTLRKCGATCRFGMKTGVDIHRIRALGSYIAGTNGTSNGLVPMLRVYNTWLSFTHQGHRNEIANITVYLEPWHSDIFDFLNLKKKEGKDEMRAQDLSYALWIPDLFMKRVEADADWCLMCPNKCPNLFNTWGNKFEEEYQNYEKEGRYNRKVKARQLWYAILETQLELGEPSIFFKDSCNKKSNQQNIGCIKSSNFSGELLGVAEDEDVFACCSAIICLDMYVKLDKTFDFDKLKQVVKIVTKNLNKMTEENWFPSNINKEATLKNRPIAIGVQGLADTFIKIRYPYDSPEANLLNKQIFETIYYGAIEMSCELSAELGPYENYKGSPMSNGIFQFDMWNVVPTDLHDWSTLKSLVSKNGVRNSLFVAVFPTPSVARIHGCSEGTDAIQSHIYNGRVSVEEVKVVNHLLLNDLKALDLWDSDIEKAIIKNGGSIQSINRIPKDLKDLYKTVWEIPQKYILQLAAERGAFVDQSQSLNMHISSPNYGKLTSMHFYAWNLGLKTGMHHLHTRDSSVEVNSIRSAGMQNSFSNGLSKKNSTSTGIDNDDTGIERNMAELVCSIDNKDECLMCGS